MRSAFSLVGATVLAVSAIAAPAASAATNILVNGDFEDGPTGTIVPGWNLDTITDPNSIQVLKGSDYIPCCGANGSAAALANQFVSFGAGDSPNAPARILQTFNSVGSAPGRYSLTFNYGAIGVASHSLSFGVFDLASSSFSLVDVVTANPSSNFDTLFLTYTAEFMLGAAGGNIQFVSFDGTASKDAFLDNVSITAVPEPATWAMMIIGFGIAGFALRRRPSVRVTYA